MFRSPAYRVKIVQWLSRIRCLEGMWFEMGGWFNFVLSVKLMHA